VSLDPPQHPRLIGVTARVARDIIVYQIDMESARNDNCVMIIAEGTVVKIEII